MLFFNYFHLPLNHILQLIRLQKLNRRKILPKQQCIRLNHQHIVFIYPRNINPLPKIHKQALRRNMVSTIFVMKDLSECYYTWPNLSTTCLQYSRLYIKYCIYDFKGDVFLNEKKKAERSYDSDHQSFAPFISPNPITSFNPI